MNSQGRLIEVFTTLADSLVQDFDATELLVYLAESAVELLDVTDAGVMLADGRGDLKLVALSSETVRALELYELQVKEGPCLDCFRSGERQVNIDNASAAERWPNFTRASILSGVRSSHALPLRLRGTTIGAMNLFSEKESRMSDADVALGQALADMATIAILNDRAVTQSSQLAQQLQTALTSRIRIEQAKGILAAQMSCTPADAFTVIRNHARRNHLRIAEIAEGLIGGTVDLRA